MQRLAARLSLIVDAESEADARGIGRDFTARTGLESVILKWTPYRKLGAHSRLSLGLYLPFGIAGEAAIDAVEAVLAKTVAPYALARGYCNRIRNDDGTFVYMRIFDAREHEFLVESVLWMDIEIGTNPDAQADFQTLLNARSESSEFRA